MTTRKIPKIRLSNLLGSRKFYWLLVIVLSTSMLFSSIGLLSTSGWFITAAAIAGLLGIEINYITMSGLIRVFSLTRTVTRYIGDLVSHNAILHLLKDLRVNTFEYLSKYRSKLHNSSVNSIVMAHRLVIDIDRLNLFPLRFFLPWVSSTLIVLVFSYAIYQIAPILLVYILPAVCVSWLVIPISSFFKGIYLAKEEVALSEYCKEQFIQSLSLLTPLLIWKTWSFEQGKLNQLHNDRLQKKLHQQNFTSFIKMLQDMALAVALMAGIWKGTVLVNNHMLTVPWLLGIILGIMALVECLSPLAGSFMSLGLSIFSRDRINELIENNNEKLEFSMIEPEQIESLELINVSGTIPNALNGPRCISFKLAKGDVLGIRGSSGVGKTTLLDLIAREITQVEGDILLNEQVIDTWCLKNTLGYLQQHIDIFDFSLADNLRIGKQDASDDELWQVLKFVCLDDWAQSREGLETVLGEYGAEVSGGQARRIALARLLLSNRSLLLLDEPFAGLDKNNIELLYRRLVTYAQDKIILIVSHHDLSIYGCDEYWIK
ncbi:MAG: ATP-binding cassette domain-containing protein [Neisseriaceae bacterium]|nr:MAG: ATP-binding cassette domain-containing protein [Neisseriaceae bacterium]